MSSRDLVFVSHANPEDNEFTRWLTLKLASLGYRAWADVTRLLGGEDFWRDIERTIRTNTVKFLYVVSEHSNQREGTLRELKVAHDVRKHHSFSDFIIPLRIDALPFGELNIQLTSLTAIDFSQQGWASGLKQVVAKLEKDAVPKDTRFGPDAVRQWWDNAFNVEAGTSVEDEPHLSNWFPIRLPERIYVHTIVGLIDTEPVFPFPTKYRNGIVTFAPAKDLEPFLGSLRIVATVPIPTQEFLSEGEWNDVREKRDVVTYLLNEAWKLAAGQRLPVYDMSGGRLAFYFDRKRLPDPWVKFASVGGNPSRRTLMGYKTIQTGTGRRHWHFAVSARAAVHPEPMLMLRTHVLFSYDGLTLWTSPDRMHRARRSQCKGWWNHHWRDRLLASMSWLASGSPTLALPLGASAFGEMSSRPMEFVCPITLNESVRPEHGLTETPGDDDDGRDMSGGGAGEEDVDDDL